MNATTMVAATQRWILTLALMVLLLSGTAALAAGGGGGGGASSAGSTDMRAAKVLIADQKYNEALVKLEKVVARDQDNADAWNLIGFSHRSLKNYDKAFDGYSKALAIKPRHTGAIEYLGELYLELGDLEQAEQQLAKLDDICVFGCDDYDVLKQSISQYKLAQGM